MRDFEVGLIGESEPRVEIACQDRRLSIAQKGRQAPRLPSAAVLGTNPASLEAGHVVEVGRDDANPPRLAGRAESGQRRGYRDTTLPFEGQFDGAKVCQRKTRKDCVPTVFVRRRAAVSHRWHVVHLQSELLPDLFNLTTASTICATAQSAREFGASIELCRHRSPSAIDLLEQERADDRSRQTPDKSDDVPRRQSGDVPSTTVIALWGPRQGRVMCEGG
jgi:hypothetical protein